MKTFTKYFVVAILLLLSNNIVFAQSKKVLRHKIDSLSQQISKSILEKATIEKDKESLKVQLDRISDIEIDKVITADKLPKDIVIGDAGWRTELNSFKYKSDLIGQLGTIWVIDDEGLLQPQGAILLSEYRIEPSLTSQDKEVVYKSFISKGTQIQGDGGVPFAKLAASIQNDQFSRFTINIEGTSTIKPQILDLQKIAVLANDLFDNNKTKGVYICTGMHVVKYHSSKYSKSDGVSKIITPVVNIGGNFYAESNEENTEYFVARQLTQLNKPVNRTPANINNELNRLITASSETDIINRSKQYSPEQILSFILKRQPTFDENIEFQDNPDQFLNNISRLIEISYNEKLLFDNAKLKLLELPKELKSDDNIK